MLKWTVVYTFGLRQLVLGEDSLAEPAASLLSAAEADAYRRHRGAAALGRLRATIAASGVDMIQVGVGVGGRNEGQPSVMLAHVPARAACRLWRTLGSLGWQPSLRWDAAGNMRCAVRACRPTIWTTVCHACEPAALCALCGHV